MNAIEQYRAGMKALGESEETINENIMNAASRVLRERRLHLYRELDRSLGAMTDSELLALVKGGEE